MCCDRLRQVLTSLDQLRQSMSIFRPTWISLNQFFKQVTKINPLKTYLAGFADNIEEWEFDAAWYEALFWPLDGATVDEVVDEAEEDEE